MSATTKPVQPPEVTAFFRQLAGIIMVACAVAYLAGLGTGVVLSYLTLPYMGTP